MKLRCLVLALCAAASVAPRAALAQEPQACEAVLAGYGQVEELYRRGDYDGAASFLQAASVLCPNEALLLYNLARALERSAARHEETGDPAGARERRARALEAYDDFLAMGDGDAEVLERARQRRVALAESLEPSPTPEHAPLPQSRTCQGDASPWPWVVAGLGAVVVAVGAGLGAAALDARAAADGAPSMQLAVERLGSARDLATGANALFVGGGLLVAAGAVWGGIDLAMVLEPRPCSAPLTFGAGVISVRF